MGEMREIIRSNLEQRIAESGYTQKEIAEKLGVSKSSVTNWIKGKNSPDVELVVPICKLLNISVKEFYGEIDDAIGTKKSPSTTEAAPGEDVLELMEYLKRAVYGMGLVKEGEDLTDRQADALLGVCAILHAIFDE